MKYLKKLILKESSESDKELLEEAFIDIIQAGFTIKLNYATSLKLNFPEEGVIPTHSISRYSDMKNKVEIINVSIQKLEGGVYRVPFRIEEISENFDLVENVLQSIGYKIEYIYIMFEIGVSNHWNYYDSFETVETWMTGKKGAKLKQLTIGISKS